MPTAKTRVQVLLFPRLRPRYAALKRKLMMVRKTMVCPRMPGAIRSTMELGSRSREWVSVLDRVIFSQC